MKKIIVILGMHRSGTSLLSRAMKVFGAEHGDNLLNSSESSNAKGHWEDNDILELNDKMLSFLGKAWDTIEPIHCEEVNTLIENGYLAQAQEVIKEKCLNNSCFAIKEPRITKLLPFWLKVFDGLQVDVRYIFAFRNPQSVVMSLVKRDKFTHSKARFLWESYNIYGLLSCKNQKIFFVNYDSFLNDAEKYLNEISKFLDLEPLQNEKEDFLNNFIDKKLNHNNDIENFDDEKLCREIYSYIKNSPNSILLLENFEHIRNCFEKEKEKFTIEDINTKAKYESIQTIEQLEKNKLELEEEIRQQEQMIRRLEQDKRDLTEEKNAHYTNLTGLLHSRSWRITAPLRMAGDIFRAICKK